MRNVGMLVCAVVVLVACGGDDPSPSSEATGTAVPTVAATDVGADSEPTASESVEPPPEAFVPVDELAAAMGITVELISGDSFATGDGEHGFRPCGQRVAAEVTTFWGYDTQPRSDRAEHRELLGFGLLDYGSVEAADEVWAAVSDAAEACDDYEGLGIRWEPYEVLNPAPEILVVRASGNEFIGAHGAPDRPLSAPAEACDIVVRDGAWMAGAATYFGAEKFDPDACVTAAQELLARLQAQNAE